MIYDPLSKLVKDLQAIAEGLTDDIKDMLTKKDTIEFTFPNGLDGNTPKEVRVIYTFSPKQPTDITILVNGEENTNDKIITAALKRVREYKHHL